VAVSIKYSFLSILTTRQGKKPYHIVSIGRPLLSRIISGKMQMVDRLFTWNKYPSIYFLYMIIT
jgi:hypothetical protein